MLPQTISNRTNTQFGKKFQVQRTNFGQSTSHCYKLWNPLKPTFKVSSPTSLIKTQLKVEYSSLFTHKICDYNRAQTDVISSSIESFDWKK